MGVRLVNLIKFLVFLLVLALGLLLHHRNAAPVTFDYYVGTLQQPLSLLLAVALLVGALLGILVSVWPLVRLKIDNRRLRRRVNLGEQALVARTTQDASSAGVQSS